MPAHPPTLQPPPSYIEKLSEDAYSSRAHKRLAALLRLKILELRAERLEYVRCVIERRLDRGLLLTGVPEPGENSETRMQRTKPCQKAL